MSKQLNDEIHVFPEYFAKLWSEQTKLQLVIIPGTGLRKSKQEQAEQSNWISSIFIKIFYTEPVQALTKSLNVHFLASKVM